MIYFLCNQNFNVLFISKVLLIYKKEDKWEKQLTVIKVLHSYIIKLENI